MSKKELEKEANDWVKANTKFESCPPWGDVKITPSGNQGYIAGAKSREKQIKELKRKNKQQQGQLARAIELIEDMYDQIPSSHSEYYKDVMEKARQFIKEVEE